MPCDEKDNKEIYHGIKGRTPVDVVTSAHLCREEREDIIFLFESYYLKANTSTKLVYIGTLLRESFIQIIKV